MCRTIYSYPSRVRYIRFVSYSYLLCMTEQSSHGNTNVSTKHSVRQTENPERETISDNMGTDVPINSHNKIIYIN
jgi:hypothetical protein